MSDQPTTKPTGRGGPGRGQGRKPLPTGKKRQPISLKINPDVLAWLRNQGEPVSALIEKAVVEHYGISFDGKGNTDPSL